MCSPLLLQAIQFSSNCKLAFLEVAGAVGSNVKHNISKNQIQLKFDFVLKFYFIMTFQHSNFISFLKTAITVVENYLLGHHSYYHSKMNTVLLKFLRLQICVCVFKSLESALSEFQALYLWRAAHNLYRGKIKKCIFYQRGKKITQKQSIICH